MKIYILLIFIFLFNSLSGQVLSGRVFDRETNEPLPFVNVVLFQAYDSLYIDGTITDEKGNFTLQISNESHFIKVSYAGYQPKLLNISDLRDDTIKLVPNENTLSEVTITAQQPFVKLERGGISTNIQNSRLENLGTATDVLGQLPLITEDNGNFKIFGKGSPLIYINNRLIRDLSELENVNSNTIKKITIITNPGPEYDASIKSVIKIETLKPLGEGLGGTIFGRTLIDRYFSPMGYVNLNYHKNKIDIFGMINYSQRKRKQNIDWEQNIQNNQSISIIEKDKRYINNKSISINTGLNYSFNSESFAGTRYEFTRIPSNHLTDITSLAVFRNGSQDQFTTAEQDNNTESSRHYINAYYSGKLLSWLRAKLDIDFVKGGKNNNQHVTNKYTDSIGNMLTEGDQNYTLFAYKMILTTSVFGGEISYGGEYSFTDNKQDFLVIEQEQNQDLSSNNNRAKQNLYAIFTSFSKSLDKIQFDAGLRVESIDFKYYVNDEKQQNQSQKYDNWFPSINFTYNNEKYQVTIGYNKSIYRPSYYQLRNNIDYNNLYAYESGNPYLKPSIDHCISAIIKWKKFLFTANYDIYNDIIMTNSIPYTNEAIITKPENFDNFKSLSFSAFYSTSIGYWKPSINLGFTKKIFKYGIPERKYNIPIYSARFRNSIMLFKNFLIGADLYFESNGHMDIDYSYNTFKMNIYLSKNLFKNKLRLNFNANDIFGTDRYKTKREINNVSLNILNNLNNRNISFSVTYNFNSSKKKYKGNSSTDELNRL